MKREIVIAHELGEVWMALVDNGRVLELDVRDAGARSWLGAILKARVIDTAPGVSGCFLEVGGSRPAFLVEERPGRISDLSKGDELIVQIVREPEGSKGLRASRRVNLSGDYAVLLPGEGARAISRRVEDEDERARLEAIAHDVAPDEHGVILRTAAEGVDADAIEADVHQLVALWERLEQRAGEARAPLMLHREDDPARAFVREMLGRGPERLVLADGAKGADDEPGELWPLPVERYEGSEPAVEAYRLEPALFEALGSEVRLPGGGRLVIQPTEALVAIDVDSGPARRGKDPRETFLRTNLEAVNEIARQLRLRDLGGLIIVDFIDMASVEDRFAVDEALHQALAEDRARVRVLPLSELCVAQLTRQRRRPPLGARAADSCASCGEGRVVSVSMSARAQLRSLRRLARGFPEGRFRFRASVERLEEARHIAKQHGAESGLPAFESVSWEEGEEGIEVVSTD